MDLQIHLARPEDAESLAGLRIAAMRPSLEAIGRFDPDRARQRFLSAFDPEVTRIVRRDGDLIGFFVLRPRPDHLYLDHLYIHPEAQGSGTGRRLVEAIQQDARRAGLRIELIALAGSPANDFYRARGFIFQSTDGTDNRYVWRPDHAP
ncbi:GNAT family N-acetyltransferase [Jannaschia marina]|uniref:GNAT family N-acetyltransferase n=1 Tax=Jannaschia marina TaxID=2741674 RepID=UPI001F2971B0|nr:GNAT family N-acetyltransferase [Jannaschia marina]